MNLKNTIDKIDKEIKLADAGLLNCYSNSSSTYQYWSGYKQGLEYTKKLLLIKIQNKKKKSNTQ